MAHWFRPFTASTQIPIWVKRQSKFFLDSTPKPNNKSDAVIKEIILGGVNRDRVATRTVYGNYIISKVISCIFYMPYMSIFYMINYRKLASHDPLTQHVIIGYVLYKALFKRYPKIVPIINSDISPKLHMQWSAALAIDREVFWWQDDYHHYTGFSTENYMPYPCTYAAVLNQKGLESVREKNPKAKVFARPRTPVTPFRNIPSKPRLGVATNANFEASAEQLQHISAIKDAFDVSEVYFRLHPNTKLGQKDFPEAWMRIAPADENIEQYVDKVDLVLVGNSAVQLKLLCAGVPVIHTQGLDHFGFDLYGYCAKGFCYGITEGAHSLSIDKINQFYQSIELQSQLSDFVNIREELSDLSALQNVV